MSEEEQKNIQEILAVLEMTCQPDNQVQQQAYAHIQQYQTDPLFNQYLTVILMSSSCSASLSVRTIAGLLLKRNVRSGWSEWGPDIRQFIQSSCGQLVADPDPQIRNAVGSLITSIISLDDSQWPDLIPSLLGLLQDPKQDPNAISGSFNALMKLAEDHGHSSLFTNNCQQNNSQNYVDVFIRFFQHPNADFRVYSLTCISHLLFSMPMPLVVKMEEVLSGLSVLTSDTNPNVQKLVCQCLVVLLEVGIQYLAPHMESIIRFMLESTCCADEAVALEACEFWSSLTDQNCFESDLKPILQPHLTTLIPILLDRMVYSSDDLILLANERDQQDENVPDRPEEIKPIFHKQKHGDGNEEEDEDDDLEEGELGEWNLRKCAAAGLDTLSHSYGTTVTTITLEGGKQEEVNLFLHTVLPLLQAKLNPDPNANAHWSIRESGILALGAIAEGCMDGIVPHLPVLYPYLLSLLSDPEPLIRSISCWTLSRYMAWILDVHTSPDNTNPEMLESLIRLLLERVLDTNKKVQEAACSAFCTLEEEAQLELVPYLPLILQNLMFAYGKYQAKNLLILYDCLGTLADSVGNELNQSELIAIVMPPLINKWNSLADEDKELVPLLECFTSIAQALGQGFQDFALPVLARGVKLIEKGVLAEATTGDESNVEFLICALDLVSGVTEALQSSLLPLFFRSEYGHQGSSILQLILQVCSTSANLEVRQSGLAFVGDLAKAGLVDNFLKPAIPQLMPLLIQSLDPLHPLVSNNASWAIGEIAIKLGAEMGPFVGDCMSCLIPMINQKLPKSLVENVSITIGRLAYVAPDVIAPLLGDFLPKWCTGLCSVSDPLDREHCFVGLCGLVGRNPSGCVPHFVYVCGAIASYDNDHYSRPSQNLIQLFTQLLHGFKNSLPPAQWTQYFEAFPAPLRQYLISHYKL